MGKPSLLILYFFVLEDILEISPLQYTIQFLLAPLKFPQLEIGEHIGSSSAIPGGSSPISSQDGWLIQWYFSLVRLLFQIQTLEIVKSINKLFLDEQSYLLST